MTIPDTVKQPLLRSFHVHTVTPGWNFAGNDAHEKDRQLLVEFDTVVEEVNRLTPNYRAIIVDITEKMARGMADYTHKASTTGSIYLESIAEYDLYCHYVAGLVGEGLSRLWSASGKEAAWLGSQLDLSNSMGILLQKTNIIRDYREDVDVQRCFWPREIWGQYGFTRMAELFAPGNEERAQWVQSAMVVDALRHATDALDYLRLLRNQSVFNFCAIPAAMALATLDLCFMNPLMFQRNIKIRKAEAASLIMRATNPREMAYLFRQYARKIHAKAVFTDPNFLRLSIACGKIEQWCESQYPSFVILQPSGHAFDESDARTRVAKRELLYEQERKLRQRKEDTLDGKVVGAPQTQPGDVAMSREVVLYIFGAFGLIALFMLLVVYGVVYFVA